MPDFDLRSHVVRDLEALVEAFEPVDPAGDSTDIDAAISFPAPFQEGVNNREDVREPTAVWSFTGRHTGPLLGFDPTFEVVTITGVTVFRRAEDTESGEVECHRVIDWLDALAQIGVTLHHRTIAETRLR